MRKKERGGKRKVTWHGLMGREERKRELKGLGAFVKALTKFKAQIFKFDPPDFSKFKFGPNIYLNPKILKISTFINLKMCFYIEPSFKEEGDPTIGVS